MAMYKLPKKKKTKEELAAEERRRIDKFMAERGHGSRPAKPKKPPTKKEQERVRLRKAQAERTKMSGGQKLMEALGWKYDDKKKKD